MKLTITDRLADELRTWAQDERDAWPEDTAYQRDLADMLHQMDEALPSAADVRGLLTGAAGGKET